MTRGETDEILYQRFLSERDEEALRILLERHRSGLTFFLFGMVRNMEDAEDLMIDAFAEAAARRSWSSTGSSFRTWLFAVGRKKALMHLRKHRAPALPLQDDLADGSALADSDLMREERNRELYLAMQRMNVDYRQVLTLLYFEDMSHEDAAQVMGKTRKQVYHLVSRGREQLREILEEMGFDYAQYG